MSLLFFILIAMITLCGFGVAALVVVLIAKRNQPTYPEDQHRR